MSVYQIRPICSGRHVNQVLCGVYASIEAILTNFPIEYQSLTVSDDKTTITRHSGRFSDDYEIIKSEVIMAR